MAELARGQHPFATILGCSDSRVPPELLFDAGFGELLRRARGRERARFQIPGTPQYAGTHLRTPLFVVLGNEGFGAAGPAQRRAK